MSCCGHSHSHDEKQDCGTKKCCKGKSLLLSLAIFAFGALVGHTVELPALDKAAPAEMAGMEGHEGHDMSAMKKDMPKNIYADAMKDMHKDMMIEATGNADVDFVKGMIPHHQGAIDMAKIVARKGEDPEIKKLAEGIIDAQKKEISMMRDWLKGAEAKMKEEAKKAEAEAKAKAKESEKAEGEKESDAEKGESK